MTNRATLAQLRDMAPEQVDCLPVDQIATLLEATAEAKADTKALDDKLNASLARRYGDRAAALRRAEGKDTGTVTIDAGECVVKCDLPAKVDWNQSKLREAEAVIRSWNEDPAQYLTAVLSVPETRYKAWPDSIRKVFEPARTLSTGKPGFKIEVAKRRFA